MWLPSRFEVVDLQVCVGVRVMRWPRRFLQPAMVACSILAGSKFSDPYAVSVLHGIFAELRNHSPLASVDQHVDGVAQCMVRWSGTSTMPSKCPLLAAIGCGW